jgi:alkanesulfonate monooxygenase SsuD/methylene tetrahydromethanopterin reductase-like flavin-dependent oxidoreductase (luciferase family)
MERTAIRLLDEGISFSEVVRLAQMADQRGFEAIFFTGGGFLQLAAVAPATENALLISGVATIYTSSPSQLYQQAVTLDRISNGRAVLGIGTGHVEAAEAHGVPYERPLGRIRDYVQAIRSMLQNSSRTSVRKDLEIWIAAMKPGMCRVAGEVGDGVLLNWLTPEYAPEALSAVSQGIAKAGRDPQSVTIASYIRVAGGIPDDETYRGMTLDIQSYVTRPTYRRFFDSLGFDAETKAILEASEQSREAGAAKVTDTMIEQLCAVGRAASLKRLQLYREIGVTLPVLAPVASHRVHDWEEVIDLA